LVTKPKGKKMKILLLVFTILTILIGLIALTEPAANIGTAIFFAVAMAGIITLFIDSRKE
jgi:hypothetical protein